MMTLGTMIGIMWASLVVVIPLSCWMLRKATMDIQENDGGE